MFRGLRHGANGSGAAKPCKKKVMPAVRLASLCLSTHNLLFLAKEKKSKGKERKGKIRRGWRRADLELSGMSGQVRRRLAT